MTWTWVFVVSISRQCCSQVSPMSTPHVSTDVEYCLGFRTPYWPERLPWSRRRTWPESFPGLPRGSQPEDWSHWWREFQKVRGNFRYSWCHYRWTGYSPRSAGTVQQSSDWWTPPFRSKNAAPTNITSNIVIVIVSLTLVVSLNWNAYTVLCSYTTNSGGV